MDSPLHHCHLPLLVVPGMHCTSVPTIASRAITSSTCPTKLPRESRVSVPGVHPQTEMFLECGF